MNREIGPTGKTLTPERIKRFGFGKNWELYVKKYFSEERVAIAQKHLLDFLKCDKLRGKSFLDVGCGSGLHSLAALRSGAAEIISFDNDPHSVEATKLLKQMAGNPERWSVRRGSILDHEFLKSLAPADIVYAWGVLHHTGAMWQAMDNMVALMNNNGCLYLALYDYDIQVNPPAEFWLATKRRYNEGNWLTKRWLELWYIWKFDLHKRIWHLPGLIKRIVGYKKSRGMAYYTDVVDWLGGWPMEFAKRDDVRRWAEKHLLITLNMKTGEANTEYLFAKKNRDKAIGK